MAVLQSNLDVKQKVLHSKLKIQRSQEALPETEDDSDASEFIDDFDDFVIDDNAQDSESEDDNKNSLGKSTQGVELIKDHVNVNDETMDKTEEEKSYAPEKLRSNSLQSQNNTKSVVNQSCFSSSDWSRLNLSKALLKALAEMGFHKPTKIQREAIPLALQGRDVLGTAETGSGKTAAFLLPILERLCQSPAVRERRRTPTGAYVGGAYATKALILLPTRELAVQCFEMLQTLAKYTPVTEVLVTGGMHQRTQEATFRQRPDIVVATPGRVLDLLLNSPSIHVDLLEIVVLDEADRLLEMGFKDECLKILSHCAKGHQTMLFSATLSKAIKDVALLSLHRPLRVDASSSHRVPKLLQQVLVAVPSTETNPNAQRIREATLLHLCFEAYSNKRTIVFFRTKKLAHRIALIFSLCNIKHAELHGNLAQAKRLEGLERFHLDPSVRFLLCSELAARGLDIPHVDLVINFSVPPEVSRYVHQVGRTARIGREGIAITLYSPEEKLTIKRIIKAATSNTTTKKKEIDHEGSVLKRIISTSSLSKWEEKIKSLEATIKTKLSEEHLEREMRLAEMELDKATNLQQHKAEILLRPKKRWLASTDRSQEDNIEENDSSRYDETRLLTEIQQINDDIQASSQNKMKSNIIIDDDDDSEDESPKWMDNNTDNEIDSDDSDHSNIIISTNNNNNNTSSHAKNKPSSSSSLAPSKIKLNLSKSIQSSQNQKPKLSKQDKNKMMKEKTAAKDMGKKRSFTEKQRAILQEHNKTRSIGKKLKMNSRSKRPKNNGEYRHCGNSDDEHSNRIKKKRR